MPASTVVLALEGVLAGDDDDVELSQASLNPVGGLLYNSFGRTSRLVLATNLERRLVDHWCRINGLSLHAAIERLDDRTVRRLRAAGEVLDLYIDSNEERTAQALRSGVPTLFLAKPLYARAGHRPDLGTPPLRPWRQIVAEAGAQRAARALPVPEDD